MSLGFRGKTSPPPKEGCAIGSVWGVDEDLQGGLGFCFGFRMYGL